MVLRWLIRGWLKQAATEQIKQAATEQLKLAVSEGIESVGREAADSAEADEKADPAAEGDPEAPLKYDLGVIFSSRSAAGGLLDMLDGRIVSHAARFAAHEGGLRGRRLVVAAAEPKRKSKTKHANLAAKVTEAMIAGHKPRWVIAAGFAAALVPTMKQGDLVIADAVLGPDGRRLSLDLKVGRAMFAETPGLCLGPVLGLDPPPRTREQKRRRGKQTSAVAVDAAVLAVAEVCRERKTPFFAVHVIRETLEDELPADLDHLQKQQSIAGKFGALGGALFRRPGSMKDLWKLKEDSLLASDRLAKFLATIVGEMK